MPLWLGSDQLIGICAAKTPPGANVPSKCGNNVSWSSAHW